MTQQTHNPSAYIYAFFMTIVGASAAAALKYIGSDVSIEFITFWQYLICLCISLVIIKKQKISREEILAIRKQDRPVLLVRGLSGLLGFYAFYLAVANIPLVDATLLRHSSPLFVPVIAFLWFGIKTQKLTLFVIALGFIGVFITLRPDPNNINWWHIIGLSSAAFLATSMVTTNRLKHYKANIVLFYYYLISLIGVAPFGIMHWQSVNLQQALLMLYVGSSIHIALVLYTKAFTLSSAAVVSPMTYLSIVHAGILGWLIWGHLPTSLTIIGMVIVIACGIATTLYGSKQAFKSLSS